MGRYYKGDIEGKFWFAVQASNDAEFFGAEQVESNYINYYVAEDKKGDVQMGIDECLQELGKYKTKLDVFFETKGKGGYNDEMLMQEFSLDADKIKNLLMWYARLILGKKILACIEENGSCSFEAET